MAIKWLIDASYFCGCGALHPRAEGRHEPGLGARDCSAAVLASHLPHPWQYGRTTTSGP